MIQFFNNAHYTIGFLTNFNIFNMVLTVTTYMVLTVTTYKNVQVLQVTTTYKKT